MTFAVTNTTGSVSQRKPVPVMSQGKHSKNRNSPVEWVSVSTPKLARTPKNKVRLRLSRAHARRRRVAPTVAIASAMIGVQYCGVGSGRPQLNRTGKCRQSWTRYVTGGRVSEWPTSGLLSRFTFAR